VFPIDTAITGFISDRQPVGVFLGKLCHGPSARHFDRLRMHLRDRWPIFIWPNVVLERANKTCERFMACCGVGLFDGPTNHRRTTCKRWSPEAPKDRVGRGATSIPLAFNYGRRKRAGWG
jgi:hypothetical protein